MGCCQSSVEQEQSASPQQKLWPNKLFVSASEVKEKLNEIVFLDCRYNSNPPYYNLTQHTQLRPKHTCMRASLDRGEGPLVAKKEVSGGGDHPLPEFKDFVSFCEQSGIGRKALVLFDDGAPGACRAWSLLGQIVDDVYIVSGGIHALKDDAKLEMTENDSENILKCVGEPYPAGTAPYSKKTNWDESLTISASDLNKFEKVFDVRVPPRFGSSVRSLGGDRIAGHVEQAGVNVVNLPFVSFFTGMPNEPSTRWKDNEQLRKIFTENFGDLNNADQMKKNCIMCGSFVTATVPLAVARHLQLSSSSSSSVSSSVLPRGYVGSWSEWSKLHQDEIVKKQVESQGFSIIFDVTAPSNDAVEAIEIDQGKYDNISAFCESQKESVPDPVVAALKQLKKGETGIIYLKDGENKKWSFKCVS